MNKTKRDYKESLQIKLKEPLKAGISYCLAFETKLSALSGYTISSIAAAFTKTPGKFSVFGSMPEPQLTFSAESQPSDDWKKNCKAYQANGGEQYLTISRHHNPSQENITARIPVTSSALDINRSAYYLFDNFTLVPVSTEMPCTCLVPQPELTQIDSMIQPEVPFIVRDIRFELNSSKIAEDYSGSLNTLLTYLIKNPDSRILISGYTDDTGTPESNQLLSEERAKAVANWLSFRGVPSGRISSEGKGDSSPVSTKERSLNRRVEISFFR